MCKAQVGIRLAIFNKGISSLNEINQ